MNVADRTSSPNFESIEMPSSGVFLTPELGCVHIGVLELGVTGAFGLPFEKIANPDAAWDITRGAYPTGLYQTFSRSHRVLLYGQLSNSNWITLHVDGQIEHWAADWSVKLNGPFQLEHGGGVYPIPEAAEQFDRSVTVQIVDSGGMLGLQAWFASGPYGTLEVGGTITGWNFPAPSLNVYVGMLPAAATQLRPYLFSYCNR